MRGWWPLLAAAAALSAQCRLASAVGGGLDFGGAPAEPERCFNLTFDELSWAAGDGTYFTDTESSSDFYTTWGILPYGGLDWSNLQIKSNASSMWSPNGQASPPNQGVSWIATPVVAVAQRGAFRPVSVQVALQAFFPIRPPGAPAAPPATLTVWSVRAGKGGAVSEFAACGSASLDAPATTADVQVGPRVALDLAACGPTAAALVFGLTERTAYWDAPNAAFLSDSYFTLDDLAVCAPGGSGGGANGGGAAAAAATTTLPSSSSVAPPPPAIYLQSPPLGGYANKRRMQRRRRALAQVVEAAGNATAAAAAPPPPLPTPSPLPPFPGAEGAPPPPARPGYVAGRASVVSAAVKAAALAAAPKAGDTLPAADRAAAAVVSAPPAAAASTAAAAAAPPAAAACFTDGFDTLSWRPTVNHTLESDAYVSYYRPLPDGAGLAWVNLAIVRDAAPPPAAASPPHYGRPRFPGPVYAFAGVGAFTPLAVSVAPRCEPATPGADVDPAACPGPAGPPPVFEVASLRPGAAGLGGGGASFSVCATAALGAPPPPPADKSAPAARGVASSGDPVTVDLSACGPAALALRFRLVPPVPAKELSFALDDLVMCPVGRRREGGVAPPAGTIELPVVDPPAWPVAGVVG